MTKINLQMYSFTDGTMEDTRENLKQASAMGYNGVELFATNFTVPADEMKQLLADLNLKPVSLHAPSPKDLPDLIPYAKALGMEYIGIGMHVMPNDAAVHEFAGLLNELGKECRKEGLMLTYHNHTQEFAPCEGKRVIDVLLEETDPACVAMEMDAGWVAAAGYDPLDMIAAYSDRIRLIHIKESREVIGVMPPWDIDSLEKDENGAPILPDELLEQLQFTKTINCPAGEGLVDWAKLQAAAEEAGCSVQYIVEREYTPAPFETRLDVLKADIEYYKNVMK